MGGDWTLISRDCFRQRHSFNCGVHVFQNLVDVAFTSDVQLFHDPTLLRGRFLQRIWSMLNAGSDGGSCFWG